MGALINYCFFSFFLLSRLITQQTASLVLYFDPYPFTSLHLNGHDSVSRILGKRFDGLSKNGVPHSIQNRYNKHHFPLEISEIWGLNLQFSDTFLVTYLMLSSIYIYIYNFPILDD